MISQRAGRDRAYYCDENSRKESHSRELWLWEFKKICTYILFHPWFLIIVVYLRFFFSYLYDSVWHYSQIYKCKHFIHFVRLFKVARFDVLTEVLLKMHVVWKVTPCLWVGSSKFPQNYRVAMKLRDFEMGVNWFTVGRSRWTHRAFLCYSCRLTARHSLKYSFVIACMT